MEHSNAWTSNIDQTSVSRAYPSPISSKKCEGSKEVSPISQVAQEVIGEKKGRVLPPLTSKDFEHVSLSDRIDSYAIFTPESSEISPIMNWFKTMLIKVSRFLGIAPTKSERIETNHKLLSSLMNSSPTALDCPQSLILDYTKNFYQEKVKRDQQTMPNDPIINEDQSFIERLDFALGVSRKIEDLQQKENLAPKQILEVVHLIENKIDQMNEGDKLLIPGGWYKNAVEYRDGIIEIRKNSDGTHHIRFLSLEEDLSDLFIGEKDMRTGKEKRTPMLDFENISAADLKSSIAPLVQIQLPQVHNLSEKEQKSLLGKGLDTIKLMASGDSNEGDNIVNHPLRIMQAVYGKDPIPPPLSESLLKKMHSSPSHMGTMMVYIKIHDPNNFEKVKLQLEIGTFTDIIESSKDLLKASTPLRHECYDAGRRLIYRLDKKLDILQTEFDKKNETLEINPDDPTILAERASLKDQIDSINESMDKIIKKLTTIHLYEVVGKKKTKYHSIDEWKNAKLAEEFKLVTPLDLKSLSKVDVASSALKSIDPSLLETFKLDSDFPAVLAQKIQSCQDLYNKGEYGNLRLVVDHIISQLPPPSPSAQLGRNDPWSAICTPLKHDKEQILKLGENIFKLSQFLFDTQRMTDPFNAGPDTLVPFAKLQAISDCLMNMGHAYTINYEQKVYLDPSPILDLIKNDHYFRSIDPTQHHEAEQLVKYWDSRMESGAQLKLDDSDSFLAYKKQKHDRNIDPEKGNSEYQKRYLREAGNNEYAFVMAEFKRINPDDDIDWNGMTEVWSDKEEKLPPFIRQQRQMRFLSRAMVLKGRNLNGSETDQAKAGLTMVQEGVEGFTQQQAWQRVWKISEQQNKSQLLKPYDLVEKDKSMNRPLTIPKFDYIDGNSLNEELKCSDAAYENYVKWHGQRELFQDEGRYISNEVNENVINFELHTENSKDGTKLIQQSVMLDDAPEAIKALRTIQSGNSRLEQTTALFMQHPEYFNDSSFYRVFECNFFAQGALLKKLKEQPAFGEVFADFLQTQYQLATGLGNVDTALTFLNLQVQFRGYIEISEIKAASKEQLLTNLPDPEEAAARFNELEEKTKSLTGKGKVLASKLCFQAIQMKKIDLMENEDELIKTFVKSIVLDFLRMRQMPKEVANSASDREIQNFINRLMPDIKRIFEEDKDSIFELFTELGVPENEILNKSIKGKAPCFAIGDYMIDLRKGILLNKGLTEAFLPATTDLLKILKDVGISVPDVKCHVEFRVNSNDGLEIEIYTPVTRPDLRIIKQANGSFLVQCKIKDPTSLFGSSDWYQYTSFSDPKTKGNALQSQLPKILGTLLYNKPVWTKISDPNQMIVTAPLEANTKVPIGKVEYVISLKKGEGKEAYILDRVLRTEDDLTLMNPWDTSAEVLGQLTAIEAKEHIHVWGKNDQPLKINFPRLIMNNGKPLSYKIGYTKANIPVLQADPNQFEGYAMLLQRPPLNTRALPTDTPNIWKFETDLMPITFNNFNVITNGKGKGGVKILIPLQELTATDPSQPVVSGEKKITSWFNRAWADRKTDDLAPQKVLVFDVDNSKRILKNASKEANAMAAYVFFAHKNYEGALQYLERSRTTEPLGPKYKEIYQWIQKWPDQTDEAVAFKLKAGLMLEEYLDKTTQASTTSIEEEVLRVSHLQDLKEKYDKIIVKTKTNLIMPLHLTEEEIDIFEKVTVRSLLNVMPKDSIDQLKPIDKIALSSIFGPPSKIEKTKIENFVKQLWINVGTDTKKINPSDEFTVISDERFVKGFEYLYKEILASSPDSQKFKSLKRLIAIAAPKSEIAQTFQKLLTALVLAKENPATDLNKLSWPEKWKLNSFMERFEVGRTVQGIAGNDATRDLTELLLALNESLAEKALPKANPSLSNPISDAISGRTPDAQAIENEIKEYVEASVQDAINPLKGQIPSENEMNLANEKIDKTKLKVEGRVGRLKEAQAIIESDKSSLEKGVERLLESGKLQKIRQDRREEKLEVQKNSIKAQLDEQDKHEKPVIHNIAEPKDNLEKVEKERIFKTPITDACFKKENEKTEIEKEESSVENKKKFEFLDLKDEDSDKKIDPATKRLALELQKDTNTFIDQNKDSQIYSFASDDELRNLKKSLHKEANIILNGQKEPNKIIGLIEAERLLLNSLNALQRSSAKGILRPAYAHIPDRLIGLYAQGLVNNVNLRKHFGITFQDEGNAAKIFDTHIKNYMALSIADKGMKDLLRAVDNLPNDVTKISSEKATEIYHLLDNRRQFEMDSSYSRELLTIEYVNGYSLRSAQVETIEAILSADRVSEGQIRQLGMGVGKSSVLLPMLLRKFADGNHLSMGVIPEWLWEIVSADLDHSSRSLFGQRLYKFEFDRNTEITHEWLLEHYNHLGLAIIHQEAVITTKTNLLSFRNKYIEMLQELDDEKSPEKKIEIEQKIESMAQILDLIKSRSKVICDEVDSVLNGREELNYAIGKAEFINPIKRETGIAIVSRLASWKNDDTKPTELKEFAQKFLKNEQASLSTTIKDTARKQLASEFYDLWETNLGGITKESFISYVTNIMDPENINIDLQCNEKGIPKFMQELKNNKTLVQPHGQGDPVSLYDSIAYARQFIGETLITTLDANNNVNYGRGLDGESTIPYKASNTPSAAEFGDSAERVAYYSQDYMQNGISAKQTDRYVEALQRTIEQEMQEEWAVTGRMGEFENMETVIKFQEDYGSIDLSKAFKDPAERNKLEKLINADNTSKMDYLRNWVLPKISMANKQVSSNANDFVDMLGEFNGFTGTPFNIDTFHDKIDVSNAFDEGTDGKSIEFLIAMSKEMDNGIPKCNVRSVALDPDKPLESLTQGIDGFFDKYNVLIDAGAYMKGLNNEQVGKELNNSNPYGIPTVIIDDANDKVVLEKGKDQSTLLSDRNDIRAENRFTYYDQAHTTGTDISQGGKARAAVTIGENLFIRDLLQSIWRMRKLRQGQQVDFIISADVKNLIYAACSKKEPDPITVEDIIIFCVANQATRVAEDVSRAERQKVVGRLPQLMFQQMVDLHLGSQKQKDLAKQLFHEHYAQHLFKVNDENTDALAAVSTKEDTTKVLTDLRNDLVTKARSEEGILNKVAELTPKDEFGVVRELIEVVDKIEDRGIKEAAKLPAQSETASPGSKDSQVQTQRQQQQQQQMSVQLSSKKAEPDLEAKWTDWSADATSLKGLWDQIASWNKLESIHDEENKKAGFAENIRFSPNFVPSISNKNDERTMRQQLLADERNFVAQVIMIHNKKDDIWQAAMIDVLDHEKVVTPLIAKSRRSREYEVVVYDVRPKGKSLVNLSTEAGNEEPANWLINDVNKPTIKLGLEPAKLLAQMKLFGGELNFFDPSERAGLESWLESGVDLAAIKKTIEHKLKPEDITRYEASYVGKKLANV